MTIKEAKIKAIKKLRKSSGKEAAIDSEILLAHALGVSREELLTHDERIVPNSALKKFNSFIKRRAKHEPIAYIVGHKEFFGLDFFLNKHTLIPRPETELLVEESLRTITQPTLSYNKRGGNIISPLRIRGSKKGLRPVVIDVGTGSGAIAIAIAASSPATTVIATDISNSALKIAKRNAIANKVAKRIIFKKTNLLIFTIPRPRNSEKTIITANLPYLPTKVWQKCAPEVKKFEPRTALDGGKDGLKYYNQLFHQVACFFPLTGQCIFSDRERVRSLTSQTKKNTRAMSDLVLICEIDPSQKTSFAKLAKRHFPNAKVEIKKDLAGLARIAIITLILK